MIRDREILDQLLDSISRYVRDRLVPLEKKVAEDDAIPDEVVNEFREMGLFGLTIPEEYGGLGLTMEEEVLVAFELGKTSPAFRSLIGTNNGIGSAAIVTDGTDDQKKKYLPKYASGESITAFCLTEPDVGSDAASIKMVARRDGDNFVLNGTKRFITNAPRASSFTVMARTNPEEPGARGITAFVVDASSSGITIGPKDGKMGQAGSYTSDVIFEDVTVPRENVIGGEEGKGFYTSMKVLDRARLHIAAISVGLAERLIADALNFAKERRQFGKPIAEHQLIQAMLADSFTEAYAARSMVLEAARSRDEGSDINAISASCKLFATEMVGRVADRAVQIHGGAGYMTDYAVERFYRDVRLLRLYEGTSQIQQLVIARNMIRDTQ
jgi:acyl-CoA dehydrogenase